MSLKSTIHSNALNLQYPKPLTYNARNITQDEVLFLMGLAIYGSTEKCWAFIDTLVKKDVSRNSIFLDLIPQTTRRLTSLWEDDVCTYSELTMALWRLQNIL